MLGCSWSLFNRKSLPKKIKINLLISYLFKVRLYSFTETRKKIQQTQAVITFIQADSEYFIGKLCYNGVGWTELKSHLNHTMSHLSNAFLITITCKYKLYGEKFT